MTILLIVIVILLVAALYPLFRDYLRRRRVAAPTYVEGLQLMLDGELDRALDRLTRTAQADTDNVDAYLRLGDIYIRKGQVERGIKIHETLALRHNLEPPVEIRVFRALSDDYVRTDRKLKAISILEELSRRAPFDPAGAERLFRLYLSTGSLEKCRGLLKEIGKRPVDRRWLSLLHAEYARAVLPTDTEGAAEYLREALRLDPRSLAARVYLGDLKAAASETEEAIRSWNELIELAPEQNHLVRHRLETAFYDLGRYEEVSRTYESLLRRIPNDEGLAVALALIYQKKGNLDAAVRLLERLGTADTRLLPGAALAGLYLEQGKHAQVVRMIERLVANLRGRESRCPECGAAQPEPALACARCHAWLVPSPPVPAGRK